MCGVALACTSTLVFLLHHGVKGLGNTCAGKGGARPGPEM